MTQQPTLPEDFTEVHKQRKEPALEKVDRLTAQLSVAHESLGNQPLKQQTIFSQGLDTRHPPVSRPLTLPVGNVKLDLGWLPPVDVGFILIESRVGRLRQRHPSEEEKQRDAESVVKVRLGHDRPLGPPWLVRPKRFFWAEVEDGDTIWLETVHETPVRITIFPR